MQDCKEFSQVYDSARDQSMIEIGSIVRDGVIGSVGLKMGRREKETGKEELEATLIW